MKRYGDFGDCGSCSKQYDIDFLQDQIRQLEIENSKLRRQVCDLEREVEYERRNNYEI